MFKKKRQVGEKELSLKSKVHKYSKKNFTYSMIWLARCVIWIFLSLLALNLANQFSQNVVMVQASTRQLYVLQQQNMLINIISGGWIVFCLTRIVKLIDSYERPVERAQIKKLKAELKAYKKGGK